MNLSAATIQFQVTGLGGNAFTYSYDLSGLTIQSNQEVDIRFDPARYGTLSNGAAGSDFSLLLLQPDNPLGTFGDYSALAMVNNPSLSGPFSVNVISKGMGTPGAQPFFINQYDPAGNFLSTIGSGFTTPAGLPGGASAPEPGSLWLSGVALLVSGALRTLRRSRRRSQSPSNRNLSPAR